LFDKMSVVFPRCLDGSFCQLTSCWVVQTLALDGWTTGVDTAGAGQLRGYINVVPPSRIQDGWMGYVLEWLLSRVSYEEEKEHRASVERLERCSEIHVFDWKRRLMRAWRGP
jgi:hypothetical protein